MKNTICIVLGTLFFISFCAFRCSKAEEELSAGEPKILKIGYMANSFAEVDIKDAVAALQVWGDVILRNMEEEFTAEQHIFYDLRELVQAIKNKKADMLGMSTLEYFEVKDKAPLEVSMATVSGGEVEQKFILLVRKDKGIKRLSQLKGKKLLVETGGRGDIGLLWLNTTLLKDRLPESGELFSNIKRATKASQAVLPVFFGQADACIVTRGSFRTAAELNPQLGGELDVLAESPPYLVSVACFREGYDEKYKKIIMDTSLKLHEDPKGKQILTLFRVDKIVLFDPTYFNSIKELINEYNELKGSR